MPIADQETTTPADRKSVSRLPWKTPLFLVLMIGSNLAGDVCLRFGLRTTGNFFTQPLRADLHAALNPWVATGMAFYLIWMLTQAALFSWADLSYVIPITAIGYALAAIAGKLFLDEPVSPARWIGIAGIVLGVVMVTRTPVRTTRRADRAKAL